MNPGASNESDSTSCAGHSDAAQRAQPADLWSGLHTMLVARLRGGSTSLHDAEDIASETIHRLVENAQRCGPPRCMQAMALGIARNLQRNFLRGRRRARIVPLEGDPARAEAESSLPQKVRWMVDDLLAIDSGLSSADRSVLLLLMIGLDRPRQLAELRGVGVRAAQRSLERVREAVRAWLSSR